MNYELYEQNWKQLANEKKLSARDFIVRAIIKSMKAKVNVPKEDLVVYFLQKYFAPVTNKNKRSNGHRKFQAIENFKYFISFLREPVRVLHYYGLSDILTTPAEVDEFMRLAKNIKVDKIGRLYVYYFTAQDMTPEQQGVQAGHALFLLGSQLNKKVDPSEVYFQWIGVPDSEALMNVIKKHFELPKVGFREPDMGNRLTAVAFEPILWNRREKFLDYPLLTH